jgi:hypothetical protein
VRCDALVVAERVARLVVAGISNLEDFLRFCEWCVSMTRAILGW